MKRIPPFPSRTPHLDEDEGPPFVENDIPADESARSEQARPYNDGLAPPYV